MAKKDSEAKSERGILGAIDFNKMLLGIDVTLRFNTRVYGSLPKDAELLSNWLKSRGDMNAKEVSDTIADSEKENLREKLKSLDLQDEDKVTNFEDLSPEEQKMAEEEEKVSCAFRSIEVSPGVRHLMVKDFMVKAMIGVAASTTKMTVTKRGVRGNLREGLQIRPHDIPMSRDGNPVTAPDGQEDFIGHVMTMQGRRSILKRCDFIEPGVDLSFKAYLMSGNIDASAFKSLLEFSGFFLGLSSQRRFEAGKFNVLKSDQFPVDWQELLRSEIV